MRGRGMCSFDDAEEFGRLDPVLAFSSKRPRVSHSRDSTTCPNSSRALTLPPRHPLEHVLPRLFPPPHLPPFPLLHSPYRIVRFPFRFGEGRVAGEGQAEGEVLSDEGSAG